jgi:hypothetical protein
MADACPRCAKSFKLQWKNEKEGELTVCGWCLAEGLTKIGVDVVIEKRAGGGAGKPPAKPTPKKGR